MGTGLVSVEAHSPPFATFPLPSLFDLKLFHPTDYSEAASLPFTKQHIPESQCTEHLLGAGAVPAPVHGTQGWAELLKTPAKNGMSHQCNTLKPHPATDSYMFIELNQ